MDRYEELTRANFASLEAARVALDSHLSDEGYIVTVLHTRRGGHNKDGDIKAVILQCSCARKAAVNSEFNQRKRLCARRGTGCLFKCAVRRGVQQDDGETHWIVEIEIHGYNHEPFTDPVVHPQGRTLTGEQWQEIIQAANDRQKAIQIVAAMRCCGITTTPRDVYNIKQAERQRILAGRSPLVALLDGLEDRPEAPYFAQFDDQRQLTHLLIISPSAKEICCRFSAGKILSRSESLTRNKDKTRQDKIKDKIEQDWINDINYLSLSNKRSSRIVARLYTRLKSEEITIKAR